MSTRTEQVLARKAQIDSEKVEQINAHRERDHNQAIAAAQEHAREKAQRASETLSHSEENLARAEVLEAAKIEATRKSLQERSAHAIDIAEHHKAEVAHHAAATGQHRKSLENVQRLEETNESRRDELQRDLQRKGEQADRIKGQHNEQIREKARAFEKPFPE